MLGKMLPQTLQCLVTNGRLASAKMDLGLERPLFALLADKLSHDSTAHGETRRQDLIATLSTLVSADNPLSQIHR
jgi:hypothetical protein